MAGPNDPRRPVTDASDPGPLQPEAQDLLSRMGEMAEQLRAMIAEVGKLRSEVEELKTVGRPPVETPAEPPTAPEPAAVPAPAVEAVTVEDPGLEDTAPAIPEVDGPSREDPIYEEPAPEPAVLEPAALDAEPPPVPPPVPPPIPPLPMPENRSAAATPAPQLRSKVGSMDFEILVGSVWLNRLGLFLVTVALGLLAVWGTPRLAPWHRVVLAYGFSGGLAFWGWRNEARLSQFGRPVLAGALALAFFTSWAAHFVPFMKAVALPWSLALMSVFMVAVFWFADRWRSASAAGLAIVLGHVAAYVASAQTETLSMIAVLFLSATAVILQVRHDWTPLTLIAAILACSSHFLWALADPLLAEEPGRFALHLAFLTAYYLVFVAADLVFSYRRWQRGPGAFSQAQRVAGRGVGPTAMALYATLVAGLFQATAIHWDRIYIFLFALAAVQVLLLGYHRLTRNVDGGFYGIAATTFATLGLFSLLGGLALNMTLAAEALLLLLLARLMHFWFLRPVAQGVLAVNFFHFWFSSARELETWPTFVGAVFMAGLYFVKARMNETWEPVPEEHPLGSGSFSNAWRRIYARLNGPLANLQALGGGVLMIYQCEKFLDPPWSLALLAALGVVVAGTGLVGFPQGSSPLLLGALFLFAGGAFLILVEALSARGAAGSGGAGADGLWASWWTGQLTAVVLALLALVAFRRALHRGRSRFWRFGAISLFVVLGTVLAGALLAYRAEPTVGFGAGWTGFWLFLPLVAALVALEGWEEGSRTLRATLALGVGMVAGPAAFFCYGSFGAQNLAFFLTPPTAAIWALAALSLILTAAAILRRSTSMLLATGLVSLSGAALVALGILVEPSLPEVTRSLARWGHLTAASLAALGLLASTGWTRRRAFPAWGVVLGAQALAVLGVVAVLPRQMFTPFWLWVLPVAVLWAAVEAYRSCPVRWSAGPGSRHDRALANLFFGESSRALAGLGAVLLAAGFGSILERAFATSNEILWAMLITVTVLVAAALARNSAYLMAGAVTHLGLIAAHRLFHHEELLLRPWLDWTSTAAGVATAVVLIWCAPWRRRASFAWGGAAALVVAHFSMAELFLSLRPGMLLPLWALTFVGCWVAIEGLRKGFFARDSEAHDWHDTLGLTSLPIRSMDLGVGLSMVSAVLLVALTWRQFPSPALMIYLTLAFGLVFIFLTAVLTSPPMAAAFAVCLTAAHPLFYVLVGPGEAVERAPTLAFLILGVTLIAGISSEWSFRSHEVPGRRRPAWWGSWYPYALAFLLGFLFLGPWGRYLFDRPVYGAPAQIALALLAVAAARALALRWLPRAALVYTVVVLLVYLVSLYKIGLPKGAAVAGAAIFVQLVTMERLIAGQDPASLSRRSRRTPEWYRSGLVIAAVVVVLVSLDRSWELQGYGMTAAWSVLALVLMAAGFLWRARLYRRTALVLFALSLLRLFLLDIRGLDTFYRMLGFLVLGMSMIAVSYLYNRYQEKIQRWL